MTMSLSPTVGLASSDPAGEGRWQRLDTVGPVPSERSSPVAVGIGGGVYVFGGAKDEFATGQVTLHNDLHRLDVRTRTWTELSPTGELPPARVFAAGAAQSSTQRMFVFGGAVYDDAAGTNFRPLSDLWAYSAATNHWSRLDSATRGPSARSGATMWTVGDRLYVFGGIDATYTTLNELWSYDLRRSAWSLVTLAGSPPPPRHLAQAGGVARFGRLTFYGGEGLDPEAGFSVLADTWQIDLVRRRWVEVTPSTADLTPPRNYTAPAVLGAGLYLHGGDVPGGDDGCGAPFPQNPVDELWRFDLSDLTWRRVHPGGDAPARIKRHSAATVDGRMYVVSGYDFHCADGTGVGQIWNREVYSFSPGGR